MRLREAVGAEQRAADHVGQQVAALRLGAEPVDREAGQRVHADAEGDAGPARGQLLDDLQVDLVGLTAAADVLTEGQAEQPGVARACRKTSRGKRSSRSYCAALRRQLGVGQLAGQRDEVVRPPGWAVRGRPARLSLVGNSTGDGTAVLFVSPGVHADPPEGGAMTIDRADCRRRADPPAGRAARPARGALPGRGVRPVHPRGPRRPAALLQEHALRARREQGAAGPAGRQALLPQGDRRGRGARRSPRATRLSGSPPT